MFRYYLLLPLFILIVAISAQAQHVKDSISDLKVEYFTNPVGIDDPTPRLSWKIKSSKRNVMQTAYKIEVAKNKKNLESGDFLWETGKINSDQSIQIGYEGPDLKSRTRYYWRVRVWDNTGNPSAWSTPAFWEMGLLAANDWKAQWIEPGLEQDTTQPQPSPMLRKEFDLDGEVQSARAYVTAHGLYQMQINGKKVGDQVFTPGWTSYNKRLQYQTYDITDLLKDGSNAVGVTLGDGWYRGWIGFNDQRNFYGSTLGLLSQIEVTYENGETEVIGTDGSWKVSTGAIRMSDIYDGETYDARLEKQDWAQTGYDYSNWQNVKLANQSKDILVAPEGPPVRIIQELDPIKIFTTSEGDTVVDMGQNMVGWVRMKVSGPKGTEVTLKHGEVLDKEGNFYTANLREADQKDTYILSGSGEEIFEPHFTFHGFRYVKIEGYPGELSKDDITGIVIHSDMEPTGHFETSNALVNQLQHNIVWGQKGNFVDVPTDCPQRDERLGWTGDIEVFAQTACYNMDTAGFLTKWLRDLEADQLDDGSVPFVIPNVLGKDAAGSSGWADASVIVPWTIYQAYGDKNILKSQYESMKGWVEYMKRRAGSDSTKYLWDSDFTFGDWLSFNSTASDYPGAYTDKNLISTAYFARSTDLLQRSAEILEKKDDANEYTELLKKIKKAFQNEYVTPSGRIMSNTQTSYLLALQFDLLPEDSEEETIKYLLTRINERGHLTTGFLGTPHLNPVLSQYGYTGQAYKLLLRKEYPSWLYPVTRGATTIWERWDGIKSDSTFQDVGMNSFNHYAYGAIGEWMYKTVAGIESVSPGYKQIAIHPTPGGGLTHARSIKISMYGKIESDWHIEDKQFVLAVKIPANTSAIITLPEATGKSISLNNQNFEEVDYIKDSSISGKNVKVKTGSGVYRFSYQLDTKVQAGEEDHDLSITSTLAELIADADARKTLQKNLPHLMESPWLSQVMGYSLERAAHVLPKDHQITMEKIKTIKNELNSIK